MRAVNLINFEITEEEIQNNTHGLDIYRHNPSAYKDLKKWLDRNRIWDKHLREKSNED